MHKSELDERERESFDHAMDAVRQMSPAEQYALIEHAVASSIRYATARKDEILIDWAQGLLTTVRTVAGKAYKAAVADHVPPDLRQPGVSAKELLAGLRR